MVQLQRSGEGLVWVKLEGMTVAGSWQDRVARQWLRRQGLQLPRTLVVEGLHSFALSLATLARPQGHRVVVVHKAGDSERLLALVRRMGARIVRAEGAEDAAERVCRELEAGAVCARRDDPEATVAAWAELAEEVRQSGVRMDALVLPDFGGDRDHVCRVWRRILQAPSLELDWVPEDMEQPASVTGAEGCRRTQLGHREGFLTGPLGARVVDRAIWNALSHQQVTLAVVPDGGHRYLGWW
jgi:cysteine synthase